MATYVMSPEERRARAKRVLEERRAIVSRNQAYRRRVAYEKQEKARLAAEKAEREEIENANPLGRYFSTIGDIIGNVWTGAAKGVEGVVDLGIGIVGAVGGIFSDEFQDTMKEAVAYDFAGEVVGKPLQEAMKYSYMKDGGIGEQIASGVGQMLPAVIATILTYGTYGGYAAGASAAQVAAAQTAAQTASLVTMGASAAGSATEEAFNDGAEYYRGLGYGIASGLVEAGTEKLTGGFDKALVGKGVLDDITSSVAKTGLKRVAKNAVEEGVEEVASELARPGLKTIYKGVDALSEYGDKEYWKGVGEAGLAGAGTGLAYGGTVGYGLSKAGIGYVGKEADIADSLTEINSLREKAANLQAEDELTEINDRKLTETAKRNYQNIEKVLQSVKEPKRKALIEKFSLHKAFNSDGSMNEQFKSSFNTQNVDDGTALASLKKSSYSYDLRGNEKVITSDLDRLSESAVQSYLKDRQSLGENITIEEARERVGRVSVLNTELSEKAQSSRRKFNKALNALNKISGLNTSFVITEANDTFNGSLVDNERMYISADAFENDTWAKTIVHEYTHLEEGSKEYAELVNFLMSESPLWQKAESEVFGKGYGFNKDQIKAISEKVKSGTELTSEENKIYKSFITEVAAHETEYILGTESFIDKLVAENPSLARKIIDKIFNLKKVFSKVESKSAKEQLKFLEKAESLYLAAARKAGNNALVKYILGHSPELEEDVDKDGKIKYNRKQARYISVSKDVHRFIQNKLKKLYGNVDGIADEIAIELGNNIYIVDSGKDGNDIKFAVRKKITINDAELRADYVKETNDDAVSKGKVSDGLSESFGYKYDSGWRSNRRQESGKELSADTRQSEDNQGGVSVKNGDNGGLKFALKKSGANNNTGYNRKKSTYISYQTVGNEAVRYIRRELKEIYGAEDGIADGIAIEYSEYVYVVDSGRENGQIDFGIRRRKKIADAGVREKYLRRRNNDSISKGYVSDGLSDRIRNRLGLDSGRDMRREPGAELSADTRQSEDNQGRVSVKDGDNGGLSEAVTRTNEKKAQVTEKENTPEDNSDVSEGIRFSLIGRTEDGRGIYRSNYPENTPKTVKQEDIIKLVQNVWSKKPIKLNLIVNGKNIPIEARFNPELSERSDLGKIAFGNRKGTASEKRITMNLSSDFYQIAEESRHVGSKTETGKDNAAHSGVTTWHYFLTDLVYVEADGTEIECYMNIDVKQNDSGNWFYSFAIEKGSRPADVLSVVTDKSATTSNNIIPENTEKVNRNSENISGTDKNIKFSLKGTEEKPYSYKLSDGKVEKQSPYSYVRKVYSKKETEGIINDVLSNYLSFGDTYGELSGKSKKDVINMLWERLNTSVPGRQAGVALDTAEYIIRESVVKSIFEDPNVEVYKDTVATLKPYLHKINLDGIKGDIKHRYDKDNSPYLLWGKRKGTNGVGANVIAMELENLGFHIEAVNEADIFFEIHEAYKNAVNELKKSAKTMLDYTLTAKERHQLKQDIAHRIHRAFDENGERKKVERFVDEKGRPTELSKLINEYEEKATEWRDKYLEQQEKHRLINGIFDKIKKLSDLEKGTFYNATQYKDNIFKTSIDQLIKIKHRSEINKSGTRRILGNLSEWYSKDNPMLSYEEGSIAEDSESFKKGTFDDDISSMLEDLAKGKGELNVYELAQLDMIIAHFTRFVETYNKVWRDGKYVEAEPIVKEYVKKISANKRVNVGWLRKWFEKYENAFADPLSLARYMDRYEKGFYSDEMEELRKAAVAKSVMETELRQPLEAFYKRNKRFLKDIKDKTVDYLGTQVPVSEAMLLYMSLNREQSVLSLAESGFAFKTDKDSEPIRPGGFAAGEKLTANKALERAKEIRAALASQFTDTEKEYISIVEKIFNEDCKEIKRKTDLEYQGYANVVEGYYVPIRRYIIGKSVDAESYVDELARVSKASFNKNTVKGAKQELYIEPLNVVLDRHIKAVSVYANLAMPIRNFDILYNLDTKGTPNKPVSVKTESVGMWSDCNAYFKKLVKDIQNISSPSEVGDKLTAKLRGSLVKFYLGLNPKVWLTQCSSFAAAANVLDVDCITKGLSMKSPDVDKYCKLAMVRNAENTVALAQGVIDNVGKFGDVLMKPIGKIDRLVVKKLFGACQLQIEKNEKLKVGTEENKIKAGELLEGVILETQQNAFATDRSAAMRSKNELSKTLTMFSADQMKLIGRVIDAIGELFVLKTKRKAASDKAEITALDADIKSAKKKTARAVGSLVAASLFTALVAQFFRWWYGKDDEEEKDESKAKIIAENIAADTVGNLFGGLPIIKEIFSFFSDGYGIDNFAYSVLNDTLETSKKLVSMTGGIIKGTVDSREVASTVKSLVYTAGQLFGIPTRNAYNNLYGIIDKISPSAAYSINNTFYKQSYRSDLAKAIEREDEDMIATISGLMLDENIGGIKDSGARKALNSLVQKGYDVIPRSVGDKITYDGEEYELTPRQKKQFEKVYFVANETLASLVRLSQYKSASDEVKAKAVNFIYSVYYNLAIQDLLGIDLETKSVLFAEAMDIEKLAIVVATANSLTADLDKNGKTVSGTKKAKVQAYINSLQLKAAEKYMVMGYLGYTNTKGEEQVRAYINRLPLSKTEKAKLLEYSGYAA